MADAAPAAPDAGAPPPVLPPSRRGRTIAAAAGYAAFAVLLAVVVLDGWLNRLDKVGRVHRQPASVKYWDGSTHYVGLLHQRSRLFGRHQGYELYAGRYRDLGYGHFVHLDLGETLSEQPVIKSVDWRADGARVTFTSGHEVFVPADYYLGGR